MKRTTAVITLVLGMFLVGAPQATAAVQIGCHPTMGWCYLK
ncbi:hypothetical protein [Ornithinimicrobium sufpigmenti]|nr:MULTISPECIES: hypothetical protein [unclassified Ornithinimicrobium]